MKRLSAPRNPADLQRMTARQRRRYTSALRVVRRMRRQGISLEEAARAEGTTGRSVKRYVGSAVTRERGAKTRWRVRRQDRLLRVARVPLQIGGRWEIAPVAIRDSRTASTLGRYWRAVQLALAGDGAPLRQFRPRYIRIGGVGYPLPTDPDLIADLAEQGVLDFEESEEVGTP